MGPTFSATVTWSNKKGSWSLLRKCLHCFNALRRPLHQSWKLWVSHPHFFRFSGVSLVISYIKLTSPVHFLWLSTLFRKCTTYIICLVIFFFNWASHWNNKNLSHENMKRRPAVAERKRQFIPPLQQMAGPPVGESSDPSSPGPTATLHSHAQWVFWIEPVASRGRKQPKWQTLGNVFTCVDITMHCWLSIYADRINALLAAHGPHSPEWCCFVYSGPSWDLMHQNTSKVSGKCCDFMILL